ncbi:hypothetical protein KEM54_002792 [Ascosphaera aggregata]|nr:hypothetical protein KEM54_002792 [Ascosphaera aggregata]
MNLMNETSMGAFVRLTRLGPISIHTYMRHCLTADNGGYYTSHGEEGSDTEVFGKRGDFVTSPEISQMFGELLGIWTVAEWMSQGRPAKGVQLVEIGPGKGTLMADMLRSVRNFKSFASSVDIIYLVEASPVLRDIQRKALCGDSPLETTGIGHRSLSTLLGVPVVWVEHIKLIPEGNETTPFIFAHEFFDALPIHAFQTVQSPLPSSSQQPTPIMTPTGPAELKSPASPKSSQLNTPQWREFVVALTPEEEIEVGREGKILEFQLSLSHSVTPNSLVLPETSERYKALKHTIGSTIEICPEGQVYSQNIARRIGGPFKLSSRKPSGAALIIDYGTSDAVPSNSLRGISKHKRVSPFESPGLTDLSADVDFTAVAEAAIDGSPGVEVYGPTEQGVFLKTLGIRERAQQILRKLKEDDERRKSIESGWKRLVETDGDGMGRIYKVLAIVPDSGGKRRPIGFGGSLL